MKLYLKGILARLFVERGRYIVNDADTSEANQEELKGSMNDMLASALGGPVDGNLLPSLVAPNLNSMMYWEKLGQRVHENPAMKLRCAECAALIVHAIRKDVRRPDLTLRVIEMGTAKIDGHFFVVAGAAKDFGFPTSGAESLTENWGDSVYTLDLWGYATECCDALVTVPGSRPFINRGSNVLTRRAFWAVGQ